MIKLQFIEEVYKGGYLTAIFLGHPIHSKSMKLKFYWLEHCSVKDIILTLFAKTSSDSERKPCLKLTPT